jgi:hypothetical protein
MHGHMNVKMRDSLFGKTHISVSILYLYLSDRNLFAIKMYRKIKPAVRDQYMVSGSLKFLEKIRQNKVNFPELLSSVYSLRFLSLFVYLYKTVFKLLSQRAVIILQMAYSATR